MPLLVACVHRFVCWYFYCIVDIYGVCAHVRVNVCVRVCAYVCVQKQAMSSLKHLYLNNNDIGSEGAIHIAKALSSVCVCICACVYVFVGVCVHVFIFTLSLSLSWFAHTYTQYTRIRSHIYTRIHSRILGLGPYRYIRIR